MKKYRNQIIILFGIFVVLTVIYYLNDSNKFEAFYFSVVGGLIVTLLVSYNDYIMEWHDVRKVFFDNIYCHFLFLVSCKQIINFTYYDKFDKNDIEVWIKNSYIDLTKKISKINGGVFFLPFNKRKRKFQMLHKNIIERRSELVFKIFDYLNKVNGQYINKKNRNELLAIIDEETQFFDNTMSEVKDIFIRRRWKQFKKTQESLIEFQDMKVKK